MTVASLDAITKDSAAQGAIMVRHSELQHVLDEWDGTLISAVARATPTAPAADERAGAVSVSTSRDRQCRTA